MELVVGVSLISMVVGAIALVTTYSLRNTQFSKNQAQATKLAQESMERVRTIKSSNWGVCTENEELSNCSSWENIWSKDFGGGSGSGYIVQNGCTVSGSQKPFCLKFNPGKRADLGNGFSGEVRIANEPKITGQPADADSGQKRVTVKVYWTDTTGEHVSDLVTVFSKI